jgi:hypothetical protein
MYVIICDNCETPVPARPPHGGRLPHRYCDWCRKPGRQRRPRI